MKIGESGFSLAERWASLRTRIQKACVRAGRDERQVQIVAASKNQPLERLQEFSDLLAAQAEQPLFGENYVQEWRRKATLLKGDFAAHLIGPLQSNKVREAVNLFEVIQSVHHEKILELLNKEAERAGKSQRVFLQVNVSRDPAKQGFLPELLPRVAEQQGKFPQLLFQGLMTITYDYAEPERARADFRALRVLRDEVQDSLKIPFELSMGMSADFDVAVEEGATFVRIGTALFGARDEA